MIIAVQVIYQGNQLFVVERNGGYIPWKITEALEDAAHVIYELRDNDMAFVRQNKLGPSGLMPRCMLEEFTAEELAPSEMAYADMILQTSNET